VLTFGPWIHERDQVCVCSWTWLPSAALQVMMVVRMVCKWRKEPKVGPLFFYFGREALWLVLEYPISAITKRTHLEKKLYRVKKFSRQHAWQDCSTGCIASRRLLGCYNHLQIALHCQSAEIRMQISNDNYNLENIIT